jgi:hypothetical protein
MDTVIVNGRDLSDFGFVLERPNGTTDGLFSDYDTAPVAGRYGAVPVSAYPKVQPRDLSFTGHLNGSNMESAYMALRDWVSRGMVEISTGLNTGIVYHGWYQSAPGNPLPPAMLSDWGALALNFRCLDPLAYDNYERVIALTTARARIPQGSGPIAGLIRVKGVTTSPLVITKRDHAGRVTGTLTLGFSGSDFTLAAEDRVELDSNAGTIRRFTNGVMTDAMSYLVAASSFPLVIGRDECDRENSAWATLEISSGGSSGEWIGARTWA